MRLRIISSRPKNEPPQMNKIIVVSEILLFPIILNSFMTSANEMVLIKNIMKMEF